MNPRAFNLNLAAQLTFPSDAYIQRFSVTRSFSRAR